jgi:hypothetical protein
MCATYHNPRAWIKTVHVAILAGTHAHAIIGACRQLGQNNHLIEGAVFVTTDGASRIASK